MLQVLLDWRYKITLLCFDAARAAAASNNKTSIGTPTAQVHDGAKRLLCLPKLLASGRLESSGISSSGETPCLLWRRRASWGWIFQRLERWVALRCLVSHHLHHPHSRLVTQPACVPQAHPKSITHQFSDIHRSIARLKTKPLWSSFNILRGWG